MFCAAQQFCFVLGNTEEDSGRRHLSNLVLLLKKITSFLRCGNIELVWKHTGKIKIEWLEDSCPSLSGYLRILLNLIGTKPFTCFLAESALKTTGRGGIWPISL